MNYTTTQFTLTEQHIKLLRKAIIGWNIAEFGAPAIDPKRPYGNSFVMRDMAEILGIEVDNENDNWPDLDTYDRLMALHRETELALQVILATGQFIPGTYVRESYTTDWKLAAQEAA